MELSEKSRLRDRIKTESIKNKEGLFQISSTVSCSSVLLQKFASILFGYADHLLFIQQIHTRTYLLIRYIQWEFSLAHKRQLPIGDANASSCLVSFWPAVSSHSAENQQVNSGFLCQMSKISALKGKRRKILFFASSSIWRGLKTTNFAQGEALKCRQRQCGNIFDCRASKFARRLGQLLWLSSAFVECGEVRCWQAKIAANARKGVICWIHAFSGWTRNRCDVKDGCSMQLRRAKYHVSAWDVAQW